MRDRFSPPQGAASPASSAPRWYRSLYWRLAGGLVTVLALMLVAQSALFLWVAREVADAMPDRDPRRLAALVASDIGAGLSADPALDLNRYLQDEYGHVFQTFLVFLRDGRMASNHDDLPPEVVEPVRAAAEQWNAAPRSRRAIAPDGGAGADGQGRSPAGWPRGTRRGDGRPPRPESEDQGAVDRPRAAPWDLSPWQGAGGDGRSRPGGRRSSGPPMVFAQVVVAGVPIGQVAALPGRPSFSRTVREFAPPLALVVGGVLLAGSTLIALVMFMPLRRRLWQVQAASERLGAGDLEARASEEGGDEVAAVARSFNQMADELASRAQALEHSDRARRQLLADVSHELMTPLTAMRGYIETLAMPEVPTDEPTRQRYLGIVTEESHRLERIIGDLLDLARLEGGGTTLRQQQVGVAALFDRVAARHERELQARGIRLATAIDPAGGLSVVGDPDRLEQALQNLAANALRHTPDGGTITLAAADAAGGVRLSVRDTGPGIPPEHLPLIFDRFYKGDASRKASGGSGLGLSIVKAIVERHGGRVTARNDRGALFEIELPSPRSFTGN